ncbi:MAG: hypothetical protein PWQ37_704 [Candidatus Petromonas sp.]|nr:hypothetical protein [Candidatus Petromonas sp.]
MNEQRTLIFEHDFSRYEKEENFSSKRDFDFEDKAVLKFEGYEGITYHSVTRISFDKSLSGNIDCVIYSDELIIGEVKNLDMNILIEEYIKSSGKVDDEFDDELKIIYYTIKSQ